MAFLCISLNKSSLDTVHLLDGELYDIDKYTVKYDSSKNILKEFPDKIAEFNHIYNLKDDSHNIKLRIFLANDKEQFIMYKKHLVAFKTLIKDIRFLSYAITYESSLFDKSIKDLIVAHASSDEILTKIKEYISKLDDVGYYDLVRKICFQYGNFIEDYQELELLNIDEIYKRYLKQLKQSKIKKNHQSGSIKVQPVNNPFAVFEHPNFSKTYGSALDTTKPIFILGAKISESTKYEYQELYDNCKKCFRNPIYYPMNAKVSTPLDTDFARIFREALFIIINGNGINEEIDRKIRYASSKDITVLVLITDDYYADEYYKRYSSSDTVILKKYHFKDDNYKKEFADIAVGLYINAYKNRVR